MSDWARFWAVDFHVHTPGSSDARPENFGLAEDIVAAAVKASLDAIAVTDHNTTQWCDAVAKAAEGTPLVVLPGVEISTSEGHLLAIWEEGTPASEIDELLVLLGIPKADRGKLDIAATVGFADAAKKVVEANGIAVAAHIDKPKGLLGLPVAVTVKRALLEPCLHAVEVFDLETCAKVDAKIGSERLMAYVQGSDTWDSSISQHSVNGIGARRTWIKASRPDLVGIKHALADPALRIRLGSLPATPTYPVIESVELVGGFLSGQTVNLCPDLNCLLGGTGAGKSLILEAIRYGLDQQVDAEAFPAIHSEVLARLEAALGSGMVKLQFRTDGSRYRVERAFSGNAEALPRVFHHTGDDWVSVDAQPSELISIAAFSQGEVLEYSRQPVGRMSLVDAGIDLGDIESRVASAKSQLVSNGSALLAARRRAARLRHSAAKETEFAEQVRALATLFDSAVVKQQEGWTKEASRLKKVGTALNQLAPEPLEPPPAVGTHEVVNNEDLFIKASEIATTLHAKITEAEGEVTAAITLAKTELKQVMTDWQARRAAFEARLDEELEKVNPGSSLTALRSHLDSLQTKLADAKAAREELEKEALPRLTTLEEIREELLVKLHDARKERREARRARVEQLNEKTAGFVKLDVPSNGDYAQFRAALSSLKVGSRVREDVLDTIAQRTHPFRFGRALWSGDVNELVNDEIGIDAASVARLLTNIADKDLWSELLDVQLIERPDVLTVRFKKPDDGMYTAIESLAHGQRCTAILVILLADGDTPVLVDQPEDALHAPWIEDYLVDRLRNLRGSRQYIFATRSPGIVVSGDAEQIVTMRATAGHGEIEANGSLERYDLNRLALHHLEGGPVPFSRRTQKLAVSTKDS